MSRIGKKAIIVPKGVEVKHDKGTISVKGPKGTLKRELPGHVHVGVDAGRVTVTRDNDEPKTRGIHGLTRTLINNMVVGVTKGYEKELAVVGIGYKVKLSGKKLQLNVGYSHPVEIDPPQGIEFEVNDKDNKIKIKGMDKELVGQVTANIRFVRRPDPYKGKGIRYSGEVIKLKVGKRGK